MPRLLPLVVCLAAVACGRATPPEPESASDPAPDPRVQQLVASVSEERLAATLKQLVSYDTRFTASNPDPAGKGIGAARQWMLEELARSSPKLQVSFDAYHVAPQGDRILKPVELRNVMAVLPGRSPRRIYVTAHYDSLARIETPPAGTEKTATGFYWNVTDNPAPGANDDGSGTALTMELARVMAQSSLEFDATLVFLALAGEEEGLIGAHLHAEKARAEKAVIDAVFNNDIVGGASGGTGLMNTDTVRVFSEGPRIRRRVSWRATSGRPRHATCPTTASCSSRGTIASYGAGITRRSTSAAMPRCGSRRRTRTTAGSTAWKTRSRACRSRTSHATHG